MLIITIQIFPLKMRTQSRLATTKTHINFYSKSMNQNSNLKARILFILLLILGGLDFQEPFLKGDDGINKTETIGNLNKSGYRGLLFQASYGNKGFIINLPLAAYPKQVNLKDIASKIMMWILLPDGKTALLREIQPKPGYPPIQANDTPDLDYMFDRFPEEGSVILVVKTDSEYSLFPFIPLHTLKP